MLVNYYTKTAVVCKEKFKKKSHKEILNIGKKEGKQILGSHQADIKFNYISTRAIARSVAVIRIIPEPREAQLFIDTEIPGLNRYKNSDGSIFIDDPDRGFIIELPFSFIMKNDRVEFRTKFKNVIRYFYYDLKEQKQVEITGKSAGEKNEGIENEK